MENQWWHKQMRIVQYNLQFKDTPLMDPQKIAQETAEMGGNVVVINIADSVVWYQTEKPFFKINEYLPKDRDLLEELIAAFHGRGIKVIGRGTFFCMEEDIYYQKPHWAMRLPNGEAVTMGDERPGLWRRLYQACPIGGFSSESGSQLIAEAFTKYDIDGAFMMLGAFGKGCWCDACKAKYLEKYGTPMPDDLAKIDPDWDKWKMKMVHTLFKDTLLSVRPNMPYLRYYWPFDLDLGIDFNVPADDIEAVSKEGNVLCTEAQDVLSLGVNKLPEWNTPALRMKMGRTIEGYPPPVGIIHTCPGMDWRHACMPEAEFLYWAAQIPANGGSYWTTFTGFSDTIPDKRMLKTIHTFNRMTESVVEDMSHATSACQVMLLSDGGIFVQGWAEALMCAHIDFDMLAHYQLSLERLKSYRLVVVPKKFKYPAGSKQIFEQYVAEGGKLIIEGTADADLLPVKDLLGISGVITSSDDLAATYLRLEAPACEIQEKIGEVDIVPLRGKVGFYDQVEDATRLVTWVPPFAPVRFAGAPPERASLPAPHTDIPLCTVRNHGAGKVMFVSYEPSKQIREYAMEDMYTMIRGYVEYLLGDDQMVSLAAPSRVMMSVFKKNSTLMVHLINGIGQRPLQNTIPCYHLKLQVRLDGKSVQTVVSKIAQEKITYQVQNDVLMVDLEKLDVWDMLLIELT